MTRCIGQWQWFVAHLLPSNDQSKHTCGGHPAGGRAYSGFRDHAGDPDW